MTINAPDSAQAQTCRAGDSLHSETGAVLVIVAICAALLVLLCVGVTIQSPVNNANVSRAQHAVSIAASEAAHSIISSADAAEHAGRVAHQIMNNQYDSSQSGFFSTGFNRLYVWVPTVSSDATTAALYPPTPWDPGGATAPTLNDFRKYDCTTLPCVACDPVHGCVGFNHAVDGKMLSIAQEVFDLSDGATTRIDDVLNGILVFGTTEPLNYLGFLPGYEQEVAAAVVDRLQATYVLIDPALSAGPGNYLTLFGEKDSQVENPGIYNFPDRFINDVPVPQNEEQWPVVWNRADPPFDVGNSWTHPHMSDAAGLLDDYTPLGVPHAQNLDLYRFYASACFARPFDDYKAGIISVLDYFASHSSFNHTTMVGLTGLGPKRPPPGPPDDLPLVPIHPINDSGEVVVHKNEFPTQHALYKPYLSAYKGFINTADPAKHANNPDADMWADTGDEIRSGYNDWSLCMCRGAIRDSAAARPDVYSLITDTSSAQPTTADAAEDYIDHRDESDRLRDRTAIDHWCTDLAPNYPSATPNYYAVDLTSARASTVGSGETVRNLVSTLGIRFFDMRLDSADTPAEADTWQRGGSNENGMPAGTAPHLSATKYHSMQTGWRYFPDSIRAACDSLSAAVTNYRTKTYLQQQRPLDEAAQTLIVFGFGPWSTVAEGHLYDTDPGVKADVDAAVAAATNARVPVWAKMTDDFVDAIGHCTCSLNIRVVLVFMPLDDRDRASLIYLIDNGLVPYIDFKNDQCAGNAVAPPPQCASPSDVRLDLFVVDFYDEIFWPGGVVSGNPNEIAQAKINAAKFFKENIPQSLRRLLKRIVFQL